jgi:hypothetical protein
MAQTGYTPIQLYYSSTTTNTPLAASLASGELAINITDGKLFYKDNANAVQVIGWKVRPANAGGTGQTSFAIGDLLYADTTSTLAKLADVATGNALISGGVGVAPSYGKIGLTTHVSGVLPVANGGTNASTASITSFNNITGYSAAGATGTTSTNLVFSASPTFTGTANVAALTATDVITPSQTKGIVGTTTTNDAQAGSVGETIMSTASLTNYPATGTWGDLTSISLTAGDWDIAAVTQQTTPGTMTGETRIGISTTSGNSATGLTIGYNRITFPNATALADSGSSIPMYRLQLASTTTVYLKFFTEYSAGTPKAFGTIIARRRR